MQQSLRLFPLSHKTLPGKSRFSPYSLGAFSSPGWHVQRLLLGHYVQIHPQIGVLFCLEDCLLLYINLINVGSCGELLTQLTLEPQDKNGLQKCPLFLQSWLTRSIQRFQRVVFLRYNLKWLIWGELSLFTNLLYWQVYSENR